MATYAQTIGSDGQVKSAVQKPPLPWKPIAWFSALLVACYAPVLGGLVRQWATDGDMGHGFLVPFVAAYIVWTRREVLGSLTPIRNYWGLGLVLWGAVQMILGNLAAQVFITRTAFLVSLTGLILFLGGTPMIRALAFPLFLAIFLFPIPAMLYAQITLPLQVFASRVAEAVLNSIGIPVLRDGNILELAHQRISVVEACSGMRSLLSLSFLALTYAYFFDRKIWMRGVLLGIAVPIAIAANAARVALTGVVSDFRPELAQGLFHILEGWVLFVGALVLIVVCHRLLDRGETAPSGGGSVPSSNGSAPIPTRVLPTYALPSRDQRKRSFALLTALILLQSSLFYGLSSRELPAPARPLEDFPTVMGGWRMLRQNVIEKDVKDVLRADDYLTRQYGTSRAQPASLFVAFFQSQRAGRTPHSPKNCLPGSGWIWSVADTVHVSVASRAAPIEINRYVVSKGDSRAVVLYWYQSRNRVVASEYKAAAFVAFDAIRYRRTDTALVRVVVPVDGNRSDAATRSGIEFIQAFFPTLAHFLPA